MRLFPLFAGLLCASSLAAHADTLYTHATQFAAASPTHGTVSFRNNLTGSQDSPAANYALLLGTRPSDNGNVNFTALHHLSFGTASVTPEPASIALLGTGLFGIAGLLRRRSA